MTTQDGWYLVKIESSSNQKKKLGPFTTKQIEEMATNGQLKETDLKAHPRHTKGKIIELKRIALFFDILRSTSEEKRLVATIQNPAQVVTSPMELNHQPQSRDETGIGRFMADGQDPAMILKLNERVEGICTSDEQALYMAVQSRPIVNFAPDAVVLTNRRIIIFRQKVLGRLKFVDALWLQVENVHMSEDFLGSTVSIQGVNGHVDQVDYLPKSQARKIYRIA
ncbi:MAG: PH domain-containing protein [Pirellulales bacterium]